MSHLSNRKLSWVLTNRVLKFLGDKAKKDPEKYMKFYNDYGLFFREGIVTTHEQEMRVCCSQSIMQTQAQPNANN